MTINCYEFLLDRLPTAYKGEIQTQKLLKVWASIFQDIADLVENVPSSYYISNCDEEALTLIASNENLAREPSWSLETFRAMTKIARYNNIVVPTHENILKITKNVTGQASILEPLWNIANYTGGDTDAGYRQSYKVSSSYPTSILDGLERFFPAGLKLDRIYEFSVDQNDLKVSTVMLDFQMIEIGYKQEVL